MADIHQKIVFDDEQVIKGLTNQLELTTKINAALQKNEDGYKAAFAEASKGADTAKKVVDDATKSIDNHTKATNQAKASGAGWKDAISGIADEINIMGHNLGGTISALKSKAQAMRSVVSSVNLGTGAMKAFKIALISTGIGAIVVALGAFVGILGKSEKALNVVNQVLAGIGATVQVILGRFEKFSGAVVKLFQGDFKAAFNQAAESVSGLTAEIAAQASSAVILEQRLQKLKDATRELSVESEKRKGQILEYNIIAADQTKTDQERADALRKAAIIEKQDREDIIKLKKEEFEIEKGKQQFSITGPDQDAIAAKEVAYLAAINDGKAEEAASTKKVTGFEQQLRQEREAAYNERMAQIKALNEQIKNLEAAFDKVEMERMTPEQQLDAQAKASKAIIREKVREIEEQAKLLGRVVDFSQDVADAELLIDQHTEREKDKLRNEGLANLKDTAIKGVEITARANEDIVGNTTEAYSKMDEAAKSHKKTLSEVLDNIRFKFLKTFDLSEGDLASIGDSFSSIQTSLTAITESAIEKNNELIASIQERGSIIEDELNKELERQEAGLANNVDLKKREFAAIKAEEAKAEKERDRLRKAQLKAQLLADSISQTSNLITMGSAVVKAEGAKGLLGVPFALAAIAAFLSIFASIKGSQKKLYRGGPIDQDGVTGFVNRSGRTDRNGGRGHRVEDSNLVLGGGEFVVNEKMAAMHAPFLEALNNGEFSTASAMAMVDAKNKNFSHNTAIVEAKQGRSQSANLVSAFKAALGAELTKGIGPLARAIKEKPDTVAYRPGDLIRRETAGKVTITQTEQDWRWKPEPRE
jgi:hypothetical protein